MHYRLLAGVLALTLMAVPFSTLDCKQAAVLNVCAEETVQTPTVWNGTYDTAWYDAEHETVTVNDTKLDYYKIGTAEELAGLAKLVRNGNDMKNTVIELTNDIILNDTSNYKNWDTQPPANNWTPIGALPVDSPTKGNDYDTGATAFAGYFNGNGHAIKGMYVNHDCLGGLFAIVSGSVVQTVVEDGYVHCATPKETSWSAHAGGIAARSEQGVFNQCEFNGKVYAERNGYPTGRNNSCIAGGIVGICEDSVDEWILSFMLLPFGIVINPLFFMSSNEEQIQSQGIYNCINRAEVCARDGDSGGILGFGNTGESIRHTLVVKNCLNLGKVSATSKYGGIVGRAYKFYVSNCYFNNSDKALTVDTAGQMDLADAVHFENAGMSKAEVAEKLGGFFEYTNDDIYLNFNPEITQLPTDVPETSETQETTEAIPESTAPTEITDPIVLDAPVVKIPELTCESTEAEISWNVQENATKHEIQVAVADDFTDIAYQNSVSTTAIVKYKTTINRLKYGRTYHIRVRAVAERAEDGAVFYSDWTYAELVVPDIEPLEMFMPEPEITTSTLVGYHVDVVWTRLEGAEKYQIETSWNADYSDPFYCTEKLDEPIHSGRIAGEEIKGKTFYIRVRAYGTVVDQVFYSNWSGLKVTVAEDGTVTTESHAVPVEQPEEPLSLGDLSNDHKIDASDAADMLEMAAIAGSGGETGLTSEQILAADVNGDNTLDASDAAVVLQYTAELGSGRFIGTLEEYLK